MNLSALQKCALLLFILITRAVSGAPLIKIADIPCACSQIQFSPINYQLEDAMKFQMVALIKLRLESHTLINSVCEKQADGRARNNGNWPFWRRFDGRDSVDCNYGDWQREFLIFVSECLASERTEKRHLRRRKIIVCVHHGLASLSFSRPFLSRAVWFDYYLCPRALYWYRVIQIVPA